MVDKEIVKTRIMESAREVFSEKGLKKATMEEIAHRLNMGKSSIYYYFKGKEEIFHAIIEWEGSQLKEELAHILESSKPIHDRLKEYILFRMTRIYQLMRFYESSPSFDGATKAFIEQSRAHFDREEIQRIDQLLQEGIRDKVFKIESTYMASTALVTAMRGLEIPLFRQGEGYQLESILDDLLRVLFYGIIDRD
jgi:AcrR family transcriptional regulator